MLYECRQEDKSVIKHQLARLEARAKEGTFLRLIYQTEIRFSVIQHYFKIQKPNKSSDDCVRMLPPLFSVYRVG